ncbi:hypothetical protein C0995_001161 [Termitomyces sp. Mi166|nr:hypothetical protein C0995_001161 [Termitomyces sp. Mi166\
MADLNGSEVLSKVPNLPPTALYGYVSSGTATLAFIILFAISTDENTIYAFTDFCGGNVMLGGIAFQLAVIVIYTFLLRAIREQQTLPQVKVIGKLTTLPETYDKNNHDHVSRSVYRLIELADDWLGRIIRTEVYFSASSSARSESLASVTYRPFFSFPDVLDGVMITLAIYTFNFIHPGFFLADDDADDSEKARGSY